MIHKKSFWRALVGAFLMTTALTASAQTDYSAFGVLDFSYGRFEASGADRQNRFNSNSMTASFVGVNVKHGLDDGWTPGITLETFVRFQDFKTGRRDSDPALSRNAFVSLGSNYGTLRIGRLQTSLFDATTRFNALGNSVAFSPAVRHVFASGNLEGVQGDFYWNRALGYSSPNFEGVTVNAMVAQAPSDQHGNLFSTNLVVSQGLFAAAVSVQRVQTNDGFSEATKELTFQGGATYNFGYVRLFGQYTQVNDQGLDVRSKVASAGLALPMGPGTLQAQAAFSTVIGPAVDRKHMSFSTAYVYAYDSVTDFYLVGMDDRVRGQTRGLSLATGARRRF